MGYNARHDEIRDNVERMRREREAYADALAIVRQFNARRPNGLRGSGRRLLPRSQRNITGWSVWRMGYV